MLNRVTPNKVDRHNPLGYYCLTLQLQLVT
uniref:Uncharacterized protein n=1 Tax=Serratia phage Spe5P4 TaxID=3159438 RepID=A0AAU7VHX3_9CAUD